MYEKMRISGLQIFWMMVSMEIGMTLLLTIAPSIRDAKQDAWISMVLGSIAGVVITYLAVKVSLLHPGQTLVEFSQTILGKWFGKIVVIPYLVMWYSVLGVIVREASDFLHLSLFRETPLWVLSFSLVAVMVYMTYTGGIETIARCSEFFGPIILLTLIVTTILCWPNFHWVRLLPVYADSGWRGIIKGTMPVTSFFGESVMLMILVAFAATQPKVVRSAVSGVAVASLFVSFLTLAVILTFGNIAANMWYPFDRVIRFISIMEFIQNVDALIVIVWLLSIFIKLSLLLFVSSYGTAQWLGIQSWRRFVWVVASITFVVAIAFPNSDIPAIEFPQKIWIPYVFPLNMIVLPFLLWVVGTVRKKTG